MDIAALLREVEPLTHVERVRRLVALGRRAAAGEAEAGAVLAALGAADDSCARALAVTAAWGSRDAAVVMAALGDRSRTVRRRGQRLLGHLSDDATVGAALRQIRDPRLRVQAVLQLRRRRRLAVIDALFAGHDAGEPLGDARLIDLLPFGSPSLVAGRRELLRERGGAVAWQRLAEHHPELAADELAARLDGDPNRFDRLTWRLVTVLPRIARRAPRRALELTSRLFERGQPPHALAAVLRELVRRLPVETFDLLRAAHESARRLPPPGAFGVVKFDAVAHRLGLPRLQFLIRHAWSTLGDGERGRRWLLRLAPDELRALVATWLAEGGGAWGAFMLRHVPADGPDRQRRELAYRRWSGAAQDGDGVIAPALLEDLPTDLRLREAQRHLERVPILSARPAARIEYARLLPFAAAQPVLAPWLGHPEGAERAHAARVLMLAVARDAAALPDALAYVHARKFEQDPVRMALLDGVAALPVRHFAPAHLEAVGLVLADGLDAADLSPATALIIERLIVRLFRVDARWGATWLTRLLRARGTVAATGLAEDLNDVQVRVWAPVLAELAGEWATRERAAALVWLAASLGKRLGLVEALLVALELVARELPIVSLAAAALGLLHRHAPRRFATLVPELIALDKSFVILGEVRDHLSCKRQDLLAPFLGDAPMQGRFASGRTSWVLPFARGLGTWTARQQQAYAAVLAPQIADDKRDVPTLRGLIAALARLAFAPPALLLAYAADRRQSVREMVVRALPRLDGGEALPVLVEALGDDRARWAIYALRGSFRELDEPAIRELLGRAPMGKVTVAKEVLRLLGELRSDAAYRQLLALDATPLHRDVRVALLRALTDHLEREETWALLARAAADPDWIIAAKLTELPLDRLSTASEARMAELLASVLARPEPEARLALLAQATSLPLADRKRVFFRGCLELMAAAHVDEATRACHAVLARMLPDEVELVSARLVALIPRRRNLERLVGEVAAAVHAHAPAFKLEVARQVNVGLAADPLAVRLHLELSGKTQEWKQLAQTLIDVSRRGLLHADAMSVALRAVARSTHPELIEARLRGESDACLRRLALEGLSCAAGPGKGWSRERRERLEQYRADAAPLVAGAAAFIFPPDGQK
jgi:hypothetical protein